MNVFEYLVQENKIAQPEWEKVLNHFGEGGWELVQATHLSDFTYRLIWKRVKA